MRHYILGTDEAGYGPNLGPLVVACTVWEMTKAEATSDSLAELESRLAPIVTDTPSQLGKNGKILLIGDSKKVYQTGKSEILLHWVQIALGLCDKKPEKLCFTQRHGDTEMVSSSVPSCLCVKKKACQGIAEQIKYALTSLGVNLCDITSQMISPRDFNRQLERLGNKSTLLSETTLSLIKNAIQSLPDCGDVTILCDKHGGRNRYADMLYQFYPGCWVEILTEGTPLSVYRLNAIGRKIEFRFQAKADRHIPAALASMTAKLLRELAMLEFNQFWQNHLPDLQPTAGYPVDAARFFGQIEETRQKLGVPKSDVWREK